MQFLASYYIGDKLRELWASLCQFIYKGIAWVYELFMNISKIEILSSDDIQPIYQRITMILAIIMVFYVTFEFVKFVIEPDKMTDKEKGASSIVKRMVIVVVLIAFVPNIFSLAYKAQNAIFDNQVFSKVILGKQNIKVGSYGKTFASNMFGMFYYVDEETWIELGKDPDDLDCEKLKCKQVVNLNLQSLSNQGDMPWLLYGITEKTKAASPTINNKKDQVYNITFDWLLAIGAGGFIFYILVLYCIDAGSRVAKLAFLQIIAPIPIIGYLSPKKDGIFQKWTKQCVTTYIDLFLRVGIIHFVLLLCQIIGKAYHNGTLIDTSMTTTSSTSMKVLIYVALVMGLLMFAKKAPDMLKELFPSSGAASGTFGLKAGERVAPLAARALGAGLGGTTRLVGGAIGRAANTARRNKAIRERTGESRKEQRKAIRTARGERRTARQEYRQAVRNRNQAHRRNDEAEIKKSDQAWAKARDELIEKNSNYADKQNGKYRSVAGNMVAGAAGGAVRGMRTGAGATKAEDIWKKGWTEAGNADKKALQDREQWLNSGGYSNVQRTISGIEQSMGITTQAGKMERDIAAEDAIIKANERLIATESDPKAKLDGAKDRSGSKIEAGEQTTEVNGVTFTYKDLNGKRQTTTESGTTSSIYAKYKADAEQARSVSDAASKNLQDLRMRQARGETINGQPIDDDMIKEAERKADEASEAAKVKEDTQRKMKKKLEEYAITSILQNPAAGYHDGVLVQKVLDTKTSIREATRDSKTVDAMRDALIKKVVDANGNVVDDTTLFDKFMNPDTITTFDDMDEIQKALINKANDRTRENAEHKGTKSRMEASSQYDAEKSDDKASGGSGKK